MFALLLPAIIEGLAYSAAGLVGNKAAKMIWEGIAGDPKQAKHLSTVLTKLVQGSLSALGYKIKVDGVFGKETELIVRQYQSRKFLITDGVVGSKTLEAMATDLANITPWTSIEE